MKNSPGSLVKLLSVKDISSNKVVGSEVGVLVVEDDSFCVSFNDRLVDVILIPSKNMFPKVVPLICSSLNVTFESVATVVKLRLL